MKPVPIIDLFAGPGGLSEGFARVRAAGRPVFKIALSIEMEPTAHATLKLRAFTRQFPDNALPEAYYRYVQQKIQRTELFESHPREAAQADAEAWLATLGTTPRDEVHSRIASALKKHSSGRADDWILIGGPPCQAYSLVGRSRMLGSRTQTEFESDHRHFLYREYLRIIADHGPRLFVMENVKGLLSASHGGELMFDRILDDLMQPGVVFPDAEHSDASYQLFAISGGTQSSLFEADVHLTNFIVRAEELGLPQARHRVIIVGVRTDRSARGSDAPDINSVAHSRPARIDDVISDLPALRSGLSREHDSDAEWLAALHDAARIVSRATRSDTELASALNTAMHHITVPRAGRGRPFLPSRTGGPEFAKRWFHDPALAGVLNHEARGHMRADLARYLFAACFGDAHGRSPHLGEFPKVLLPQHQNVEAGTKGAMFSDRFRVQVYGQPSTTITSHISKDGHYFIHPDPKQCRSLTVREAARLQTFPDNYFFEGPRTKQYIQVGNAVPPLLAHHIASVLTPVLRPTLHGVDGF